MVTVTDILAFLWHEWKAFFGLIGEALEQTQNDENDYRNG